MVTSLLLLLVAAAGIVVGRPSENTIRYQIQEELPAGTRVGNIVSDAGLRRRFPKNVVSRPSRDVGYLSLRSVPSRCRV